MTQLTLFDGANLHRQSDPITSVQAAREIELKLSKLQRAMATAFARAPVPLTAREAAAQCYHADPTTEEDTYRKRSGELQTMGIISPNGRRKCSISGKSAETWRAN